MSRTSYYYDPPKSLHMIHKPGLVCDICGRLDSIEPANSLNMIPMPCSAMDEEYGHDGGNVHAHIKCARKQYRILREELRAIEAEFEKRNIKLEA